VTRVKSSREAAVTAQINKLLLSLSRLFDGKRTSVRNIKRDRRVSLKVSGATLQQITRLVVHTKGYHLFSFKSNDRLRSKNNTTQSESIDSRYPRLDWVFVFKETEEE